LKDWRILHRLPVKSICPPRSFPHGTFYTSALTAAYLPGLVCKLDICPTFSSEVTMPTGASGYDARYGKFDPNAMADTSRSKSLQPRIDDKASSAEKKSKSSKTKDTLTAKEKDKGDKARTMRQPCA